MPDTRFIQMYIIFLSVRPVSLPPQPLAPAPLRRDYSRSILRAALVVGARALHRLLCSHSFRYL